MGHLWQSNTEVRLDQTSYALDSVLKNPPQREESVFLIPAQRVLILQNGWPRDFMNYAYGDPFVIRNFSENIRILMEKGLGESNDQILFPQSGRFKKELRTLLTEHIFRNAAVKLDKANLRKRLVLEQGEHILPFMSWSAGQKEFMPLLLGLYWLLPSSRGSRKSAVDWVILEEPEMGLHPRAMKGVLLFCLELIHRGYKVILSTHSPQILELIWAIQEIRSLNGSASDLLSLFELSDSSAFKQLAEDVLADKIFKSWFFKPTPEGVITQDISSLDPGSDSEDIQTWGELTSFPSEVSDLISSLVQRQRQRQR
jgi:hypothetical protein